jgi:hypothetical protein
LLVGAVALTACRPRREPTELEVPVTSTPTPSARAPIDRTLPGELAEGPDKAWTLVLPRALVVRARLVDMIYGDAEVPPDRMANYIRQHVASDKVETGPSKTVFPRATVRGQPGVELAIEVLNRGGSSEVQIRNLSLVKMTPGLTEEERWRAAGLKPDGTPLDPTHLE